MHTREPALPLEHRLETKPILALERLRKRHDFQALSKSGHKFVTRSMVFLAMNQSAATATKTCRIGFTTTRKLGNAVVRNRIRRRLREAARLNFAQYGRAGCDYVIIARPLAGECQFSVLQEEMRFALGRLHKAPLPTRVSNMGQSADAHPTPSPLT